LLAGGDASPVWSLTLPLETPTVPVQTPPLPVNTPTAPVVKTPTVSVPTVTTPTVAVKTPIVTVKTPTVTVKTPTVKVPTAPVKTTAVKTAPISAKVPSVGVSTPVGSVRTTTGSSGVPSVSVAAGAGATSRSSGSGGSAGAQATQATAGGSSSTSASSGSGASASSSGASAGGGAASTSPLASYGSPGSDYGELPPTEGAPSKRARARIARRERLLKETIEPFQGCLVALPADNRQLLELRTGYGDATPLSPRAAAARLHIDAAQVMRSERQAVRELTDAAATHRCARTGEVVEAAMALIGAGFGAGGQAQAGPAGEFKTVGFYTASTPSLTPAGPTLVGRVLGADVPPVASDLVVVLLLVMLTGALVVLVVADAAGQARGQSPARAALSSRDSDSAAGVLSGRREGERELTRQRIDLCGGQDATAVERASDAARMAQAIAVDLAATEQRQVGLGEAQGALHEHLAMPVLVKSAPHRFHLSVETGDELVATAPLDRQSRRAEQRLRDAHVAADRLGVDHEHAGGRDREVVDVAVAQRHATVVEQLRRAFGSPTFERPGNGRLAQPALTKSRLMLRLATDGEDQAADQRMLASRAKLPVVFAA
jgi:hypothetical protein